MDSAQIGGSVSPTLVSPPPGWVTVLSLCALAVLWGALVFCGGASAQIAHPRALLGDQNTSVLHGQYIWKSQGFSVSNHVPFVEAEADVFRWCWASLGIIDDEP